MFITIINKILHSLFINFLRLLSFLPLKYLRLIGNIIGFCVFHFSNKASKRLKHNLLITKICNNNHLDNNKQLNQMAFNSCLEFGKTIIETACIAWNRNKQHNASLIVKVEGLDLVKQEANSNTSTIVFLTPHMGNFEIAAKATASFLSNKKFTFLYKPSKNNSLQQMMLNGRKENNITLTPTNKRGIMTLIKAIKQNNYIGILPDSVASSDGVWVNFFNQKVFATTLASKIILQKKLPTFIVTSYRVSDGFHINYIPYKPSSEDIAQTTQEIYSIIMQAIMKHPTQYFWTYDRFRKIYHAESTQCRL